MHCDRDYFSTLETEVGQLAIVQRSFEDSKLYENNENQHKGQCSSKYLQSTCLTYNIISTKDIRKAHQKHAVQRNAKTYRYAIFSRWIKKDGAECSSLFAINISFECVSARWLALLQPDKAARPLSFLYLFKSL